MSYGYHNGNRIVKGGFPPWPTIFRPWPVTIVVMVARIGPRRAIRVYLAAWREAERPTLTQEALGLRFQPPVDKATISRWESITAIGGKDREGRSLSVGVVAAYAEALGREAVEMYRPPAAHPSLDALLAKMPPDLAEQAINVVTALAKRRAS